MITLVACPPAALDPHVDERTCETVPGNGKKTVLGAMRLINENSVERVLALVDADLDGVVGDAPSVPNVIRTELYDLDAEIFFAGTVVERVVASHTDRRLRRSDQVTTRAVVDTVTELASFVGLLRLCSDRHGYGLKIRCFPFNEVVRRSATGPTARVFVEVAVARTPACTLSVDDLVVASDFALADCEDLRRICSGHDLFGALSALARKRWGGSTGAEQIAMSARAAFHCPDLGQTSVFRSVLRWSSDVGATVWSCSLEGTNRVGDSVAAVAAGGEVVPGGRVATGDQAMLQDR